MAEVRYNIYVDWDATNWAATPDFSQPYDRIAGLADSDGINFIAWKRGKQREEGNAPAAILEIRLRAGTAIATDIVSKYSPFTEDPDLQGKVRPWLPVKVTALLGDDPPGDAKPVYFGFIQRLHYDPHPGNPTVSIYCTDGTDLLARQVVTLDPRAAQKEICSDGRAIEKILDASGWSATRRRLDTTGGDDLLAYPRVTPY